VLTVYGGRAYEPQIDALRKGIDVVVGTPGRLLDLVQQRHLVLGAVRILVLDEADEMLDLGFLPDIEKLMSMVPVQRQTMLFSATMPGPIVALNTAPRHPAPTTSTNSPIAPTRWTRPRCSHGCCRRATAA
jgi:superfamily II DNA/RNA helicase